MTIFGGPRAPAPPAGPVGTSTGGSQNHPWGIFDGSGRLLYPRNDWVVVPGESHWTQPTPRPYPLVPHDCTPLCCHPPLEVAFGLVRLARVNDMEVGGGGGHNHTRSVGRTFLAGGPASDGGVHIRHGARRRLRGRAPSPVAQRLFRSMCNQPLGCTSAERRDPHPV